MRDHMLNWQLPAQPLGPAIRKQSKPAVWPFPLPPKEPTFVADCRTMDSDRPKTSGPLVFVGVGVGVDMGKPADAPEPLKPAQAKPQADAEGWVAHKPGPRPAHLKAGMKVELKWNSAINATNVCVLQDPFGNGWEDGIVAYRVVPA